MNIICTACTPDYIDNAKVLLQSLKENGNVDCEVWVAYIGFERKLINHLYPIYNKVNFMYSNGDKNTSNCIRAVMMYDALTTTQKYNSVLWLDSDIIVRNDMSSMFKYKSYAEIKVMLRDTKKERSRFQNGVIGFNNRIQCREMCKALAIRLKEDNSWYQDQLQLYRLWLDSDIMLDPIGYTHNDWEFREESTIWHCKQAHKDNPKWKNEYNHYLERANKCL